MTADRRALLRERLTSRGLESEAKGAGIPRRSHREKARLSLAQTHVRRYEGAHPGSLSNNLGLLFDITGQVDEAALASAVARIVARHEILRTTYGTAADGASYQRVHDALPFLASFARATPEEAAERAGAALRTPFVLETDAPLRLLVFRTGAEHVVMALIVHHIVWDGATFDVICRELPRAYADPSAALPELRLQYGDVAEWQAGQQAAMACRDLAYWTDRLAAPRPPRMPAPGGGDPKAAPEAAGRVDYRLAASAALNQVASRHRVTPFVAFIACWAAVLSRGEAEEVTVGTAVLVRDEPGTETLIGNFANHIVLRLPTGTAPTSSALMASASSVFDAAFSHRSLPYEDLVQALGVQALDAPPALFGSLVVFIPSGTDGPRLPGATTTWRRLHNDTTQFPLVPLGLEVFVRGRGAQATIDVEATYARNAFDADAVHGLLTRLDDAIQGASRNAW